MQRADVITVSLEMEGNVVVSSNSDVCASWVNTILSAFYEVRLLKMI